MSVRPEQGRQQGTRHGVIAERAVACESVARTFPRKVSQSESHNYLTERWTSRWHLLSLNAMAIEKKHGKGRLDKWYKLAKEKGKELD